MVGAGSQVKFIAVVVVGTLAVEPVGKSALVVRRTNEKVSVWVNASQLNVDLLAA